MNPDLIVPILGILSVFVFAPLFLFVIPTWLFLHYREERAKDRRLTTDDRDKLGAMTELADRMEDRIQALESILDSDHPGWRNQ